MPRLQEQLPIMAGLQVPRQWWVPESVEHLRTMDSWPQDISLKALIYGQLAIETDSMLLPKYLLVIYQLTL